MGIKRKILLSIATFSCCISLVSCSFPFANSNPDAKRIENATSSINDDGTRSWTSHVDNTKLLSYQGIDAMESIGEQKLLVVPVSFASSTYSQFDNVPTSTGKDYKQTLYDAFFGDSNLTGWESVSSFYKKSSYGKLNLTGEVSDAVVINNTLDYYNNLVTAGQSSYTVISDLTKTIMGIVLNKNPDIDYSSYDKNNDEILDAVWFVYNVPYSRTQSLSWALTTTNKDSQRNNRYKVGTFSWASYWFMSEGAYLDSDGGLLPDCHTYIHETGHIMGLDDYYSYDSSSIAPAGCLDMMDCNIGDHMAYSKFLLDWIDPKEIISAGIYELKDFQTSGEAFIIGNNYNGTSFDEFLILEYYSPTNLNYLDATYNYAGGYKMFDKEGLRIYHIDSRLGFVDSDLNWDHTYLDEVNYYVYGNKFSYIINSNTASYCLGNKDFALVEIVSKATQGDIDINFNNGRMTATNNDLFYADERLSSYSFNDGSSLPFTIKVNSISEGTMTLEFIQ